MKERPILFSTPMVQAILEGRKTVTRRTTGLELINESPDDWTGVFMDKENKWQAECEGWDGYHLKEVKCPYGQVGDVLWVRESFQVFDTLDRIISLKDFKENGVRIYSFKQQEPERVAKYGGETEKWKPSIHMPKSIARIWLEITDIKVERLQDISEDDAEAEGIELVEHNCFKNYNEKDPFQFLEDPIGSFQSLWQSINGTENWNANPWVWVVSFKVSSKKS